MKLSDIILNEAPGGRQATIKLSQLTFNVVKGMFGDVSYGVNFPNPDDSMTTIFNSEQLERWKQGIEKRYGDVNIRIDTEAQYRWDKVKILDDKFIADKERYTAGKAAWLDKERAAGRTSGLD